jgi:CrcB protein
MVLGAAMLESSLWIALGGAIGSVMRFWLAELVGALVDSPFPWATVITNITGSFVIGFYATLTGPEGRLLAGPVTRQFVMVGICGGYTTFSAFSLQTLTLAQSGDWLRAGANVGASVALCLVAVWLGHVAAAAINTLRG